MAHAQCMLDTLGCRHTLIFNAFPRQRWLRERASMLGLYVHSPSCWLIWRFLTIILSLGVWMWRVVPCLVAVGDGGSFIWLKTCTRGCWEVLSPTYFPISDGIDSVVEKEGSVHVPNCKSFLVTEVERKHVRRRARFQQHRDASCHQVFFLFKARRRMKFTPFW